jgi:hypothetical protein
MAKGSADTAVSNEELRRAVLYLADAMLVTTAALDRVATHSSMPLSGQGTNRFSSFDWANLRHALSDARHRLDSVVDLLAEADASGNG